MRMTFEKRVMDLYHFGYSVAVDGDEFIYRDENNELHRVPIDNNIKNMVKRWYEREIKNGAREKLAEKIVTAASKKVEEEKKSKRKESKKMAKSKKVELVEFDNITGLIHLLQKKGVDCKRVSKQVIEYEGETVKGKSETKMFLYKKGVEVLGAKISFETTSAIQFICLGKEEDANIEYLKELFALLEIPYVDGYYIYKNKKHKLYAGPKGLYLNEERIIPAFYGVQETITISKLIKDNLNLDHYCQRKQNQWNKTMEGQLLASILNGIVINPIITAKYENEQFVVDGKQRLTTLKKFIQDDETFVVLGEKIKFSEMSEDDKDLILNYNIHVVRYGVSDEKQISILFNLYNNQAPLSGDQKARGIADGYLLEKLHETLKHNFLAAKCNFTKGDILKGADETILIQSLMILSGFDFKNFSFKEVNRFLEQLKDKSEIDKLFDVLNANLDVLDSFIEEKQKNLKKINLPMILSTVRNDEDWKNKLIDFLENYETKEDYRQFCQGSTSQREMVMGRLDYFKNF